MWIPVATKLRIPIDEFYRLNPKTFERRRTYYEKQLEELYKDEDEQAWLSGQYFAYAIGSCFSKRSRYPDKPFTLKREEEAKTTDAMKFWEFAQAFNANFAAKKAIEKLKESEVSDDASGN